MKNKVLTITPNPALDISGVVEKMIPNEKSYVQNETHAPGGNAINVARILNRLAVPVTASGFLGGASGKEVADLLSKEHIPHHFIKTKEPTRINITVSNQNDHRQTRLSFQGPRIEPTEKNQLVKYIRNTADVRILVIGGSFPQRFNLQDLQKLLRIAEKAKVPVVVDCPGSILKKLGASKLLLIKPNLEEFQAMTKSRATSLSEVKKRALKLLDHVSFVCVSSVEGGALLVTRSGCYFGKIPPVKIKSTVGAGDSMVGAMVAQFYKGDFSAPEVLRWGLGAAAATLSETGTTLGSAFKIQKFYKQISVTEV